MKNSTDNSLCRIVSAGDFSKNAFLQRRKKEPEGLLIAADAGYLHLKQFGVSPDLFVGDADSLGSAPAGIATVSLPTEKDDTDTLAAIREGLRRGFCRFEIFGALGGKRFSHALANLQALLFLREKGCHGELVDENCSVFALKDEAVTVEGKVFFSVFAAGDGCTVTETGAKYPLDRYEMKNSFPIGVSNEPDPTAEITAHGGTAFLVIEKKD